MDEYVAVLVNGSKQTCPSAADPGGGGGEGGGGGTRGPPPHIYWVSFREHEKWLYI